MTSKRIGLALSGGVARGAAHVGVLAALEEAGIPIDIVVGASAGALIGAAYCAGLTPQELETLSRDVGWRQLVWPAWSRLGLLSFKRIEWWLERLLGPVRFEDLVRPFGVVATDLNRCQPVLIHSGPVAPVVHGSCAVPGFVVPVYWKGHMLVDGGVTSNLPVLAARILGADYVIGVDLFKPQLRRGWGPLGPGAMALEIMVRRSGGGLEEADCLIVPSLAGWSYVDFSRRAELIELGRAAVQAQLPQLRATLNAVAPADIHQPSVE